MKHRFCPSCGSLDMKRLPTGMEECLRCKYRGEFKEGSMDEINAFRKSAKASAQSAQQGNIQPPLQKGPSALKEKLSSLKGKKTDEFEIM